MNIVIYGKESCPYCNKAKQLLDDKNLSYTYIDVIKEMTFNDLQSLKRKMNMNTVPMIVINDKLIGGYRELSNLDLTAL